MRNLSLDILPPSNRQKRGNVTNFSDASRRRLIDLTARLDLTGAMPKFLTLTFAGTPTSDEAKNAFRKFAKRLRRRFSEMSALWRVELQTRGSAHFHLIIFNMPFVLQAELQSMWQKCTQEPLSIVFIQAIKNGKQVMNYVSKYIAKREAVDDSAYLDKPSYLTEFPARWQGRHWGIINHDKLPYAKRQVAFMRCSSTARYFWYMVSQERQSASAQNPLVAKLYSDDAQKIYDTATSWSRASLIDDHYIPRYEQFDRRAVRKRIERFFAFSRKGLVKRAKHERSELALYKSSRVKPGVFQKDCTYQSKLFELPPGEGSPRYD